jgi:hypothetical protein
VAALKRAFSPRRKANSILPTISIQCVLSLPYPQYGRATLQTRCVVSATARKSYVLSIQKPQLIELFSLARTAPRLLMAGPSRPQSRCAVFFFFSFVSFRVLARSFHSDLYPYFSSSHTLCIISLIEITHFNSFRTVENFIFVLLRRAFD